MFCFLRVNFKIKFDVYICFIKVNMDKWMDITDMGYVIASRYNVILVSLSQQQSMTFFSLRSQPPVDFSVHRIICIGHVYVNHFVKVNSRYKVFFLIFMQSVVDDWVNIVFACTTGLFNHYPLPPVTLLWSSNCHSQAKQWPTPYINRIQHYRSFMMFKRDCVDINDAWTCTF